MATCCLCGENGRLNKRLSPPASHLGKNMSGGQKFKSSAILMDCVARVVKLVDAGDSKSPAARRAGSIPAPGTNANKRFPPFGGQFISGG